MTRIGFMDELVISSICRKERKEVGRGGGEEPKEAQEGDDMRGPNSAVGASDEDWLDSIFGRLECSTADFWGLLCYECVRRKSNRLGIVSVAIAIRWNWRRKKVVWNIRQCHIFPMLACVTNLTAPEQFYVTLKDHVQSMASWNFFI